MKNPLLLPTTANHIMSVRGFTAFVIERELIRQRRLWGDPAPWTEDKVLQTYRFCNVRRRDDKVSQWLLDNIFSITEKDYALTAALVRLINWPPTLKFLIFKGILPTTMETFDRDAFIDAMAEYKRDNVKAFTGAYMVFPTNKYAPKEVGVADTLTSLIERREPIRAAIASNSVANTAHEIDECAGLAAFMAGQISADLTYLPGQLDLATDLYTWAPLGPGSQKGMNYMLGFKVNKKWKQADFNKNLIDVWHELTPYVKFADNIPMTLHDVQNCFCEYSKYARTILGDGRPRSKYTSQGNLF